jgi:hypothetical protein
MANKLDINSLLSNSLAKKQNQYVAESSLNLNLESVNRDCPGCGTNNHNPALALNLESVAFQERVQDYIGEDVMNNIKGALGAGLATFAVLEARNS